MKLLKSTGEVRKHTHTYSLYDRKHFIETSNTVLAVRSVNLSTSKNTLINIENYDSDITEV